MRAQGLDALVFAQPETIRYATGAFPGVATFWRRAGAAFAQSIHRVLEQQHLNFALPSSPTRRVGSSREVRAERLAERGIRRRGFDLLRQSERGPPVPGAALDKLDAVGREMCAQAREQRRAFVRIEIADDTGQSHFVATDLERRGLGTQPVPTARLDSRSACKPGRDRPIALSFDAEAPARYRDRPAGLERRRWSDRQQACQCRSVGGGELGRRGIKQIRKDQRKVHDGTTVHRTGRPTRAQASRRNLQQGTTKRNYAGRRRSNRV